MKIYDISLPISPDMTVWPGDPPVSLERVSSMDAGAHANVSRLTCGVHTGTHVDAPNHFLNDRRTTEALSLEILTGPAHVIQVPDEVNVVDDGVLEKAGVPAGTVRLLLRTRNSHVWERGQKTFQADFVGINAAGAEWLVAHGIRLIGIDYLSVSPYKQSVPPHQALLKPGVIILEGVDLSAVPAGEYQLVCLPLKLVGSDGAPARAILMS
ncbi:MAG TPA: cyclase family protein [Anaerolineales bacterium]|nr:cyclase family protein [Anaerolineales bacterium]